MIKSRYNLITRIDDNNYALFNPLSGAFDIAEKTEAERFNLGMPADEQERTLWLRRGYFFESAQEEKSFRDQRYFEFLAENDRSPTQFLLVLTYGCNFDCLYCYQKGIEDKKLITKEKLEAAVRLVTTYRENENKEVVLTMFGGEPLLPGANNRAIVEHLIELSNKHSIGLSVVTNGYTLKDYMPLLSNADINEIHVSLDGDKAEHDKRRKSRDGGRSFDRIIQGIDLAVKRGFLVNVRLIVDKKNIGSLPSLAVRLDQRGYLDLPKEAFKTSLGRNYELMNNYTFKDDLYELDELYEEYVRLISEFPILKKLHVPSFFGITQMIETGEMYIPSFDTCPAAKSEYVLDPDGLIYGCTASCGRNGYELGTYYPTVNWDERSLREWRSRSILNIEECETCEVGVICGGGCGVVAVEKNFSIHSPACKPVKNILDMGIKYYGKVLNNLDYTGGSINDQRNR